MTLRIKPKSLPTDRAKSRTPNRRTKDKKLARLGKAIGKGAAR